MSSPSNLKGAVEALVFLASEPVNIEEMAQALEVDSREVEGAIEELKQEYNGDEWRGIQLDELAGGYIFSTRLEFGEYIRRLHKPKLKQRITQASLETLAIIAYRQPITRAEIEDIRGVKAEKALFTLVKKGLIKEVGRLEKTGTPILYGTTDAFLKHFGLADIDQLPDPDGLRGEGAPDLRKGEVEEGLQKEGN